MSAEQGLIVSVSGIRGIVGQSLTPAAALAFASARGEPTGGGPIVVSRDGRPSGTMLRHAVLAGLTAAGCDVHDIGIAPTPTVGLAVRQLSAADRGDIHCGEHRGEVRGEAVPALLLPAQVVEGGPGRRG